MGSTARISLATDGQSPMAAIIGCAEGSIVGSTEYCIGHLRTPLVLVMGHTKCGAMADATQLACGPASKSSDSKQTMLQSLLTSLGPPVKEAVQICGESASLDEIA